MSYTNIISPQEVFANLDDPSWVMVDCRFDLIDKEAGKRMYLKGHIPGAFFADLERDLSARPKGTNGRHPLPSVEDLTSLFSRLGIGANVQVVAYDDIGGGIASRLWWSLRYLGHQAVAVLNGGFSAWQRAGFPTHAGEEARKPATFKPELQPSMTADVDEILTGMGTTGIRLLDSRSPERYRGDEEPLDPVAGRIQGAINRFWGNNLDEGGNFLPSKILRNQFESLLGDTDTKSVIVYCGSGVTACLNLLAMEIAGLEAGRLYPGSWSEWCSDPDRPVGSGDFSTDDR